MVALTEVHNVLDCWFRTVIDIRYIGLLVAACANIAPEGTFGVAIADVGVLDMLKVSLSSFHLFLIANNASQFSLTSSQLEEHG